MSIESRTIASASHRCQGLYPARPLKPPDGRTRRLEAGKRRGQCAHGLSAAAARAAARAASPARAAPRAAAAARAAPGSATRAAPGSAARAAAGSTATAARRRAGRGRGRSGDGLDRPGGGGGGWMKAGGKPAALDEVALDHEVGGPWMPGGAGEAGVKARPSAGAAPLVDIQAGDARAQPRQAEHVRGSPGGPARAVLPVAELDDAAGLGQPHLARDRAQHGPGVAADVVVGVLVVVQAPDAGA